MDSEVMFDSHSLLFKNLYELTVEHNKRVFTLDNFITLAGNVLNCNRKMLRDALYAVPLTPFSDATNFFADVAYNPNVVFRLWTQGQVKGDNAFQCYKFEKTGLEKLFGINWRDNSKKLGLEPIHGGEEKHTAAIDTFRYAAQNPIIKHVMHIDDREYNLKSIEDDKFFKQNNISSSLWLLDRRRRLTEKDLLRIRETSNINVITDLSYIPLQMFDLAEGYTIVNCDLDETIIDTPDFKHKLVSASANLHHHY